MLDKRAFSVDYCPNLQTKSMKTLQILLKKINDI